LNDAVEKRQPISKTGQRLKFFYATQTGQAPPEFLVFVNRSELFSNDYTKYLTREMRRAFGFEGCPLILHPKARPKTIESKRTKAPPGGRKHPAGGARRRRAGAGRKRPVFHGRRASR
jgi:GTP-binding protein